MKYRFLTWLDRQFPTRKIIVDFHQFLLWTSIGGMVAFLFSGANLPLWTLAAVCVCFFAGVAVSKWED